MLNRFKATIAAISLAVSSLTATALPASALTPTDTINVFTTDSGLFKIDVTTVGAFCDVNTMTATEELQYDSVYNVTVNAGCNDHWNKFYFDSVDANDPNPLVPTLSALPQYITISGTISFAFDGCINDAYYLSANTGIWGSSWGDKTAFDFLFTQNATLTPGADSKHLNYTVEALAGSNVSLYYEGSPQCQLTGVNDFTAVTNTTVNLTSEIAHVHYRITSGPLYNGMDSCAITSDVDAYVNYQDAYIYADISCPNFMLTKEGQYQLSPGVENYIDIDIPNFFFDTATGHVNYRQSECNTGSQQIVFNSSDVGNGLSLNNLVMTIDQNGDFTGEMPLGAYSFYSPTDSLCQLTSPEYFQFGFGNNRLDAYSDVVKFYPNLVLGADSDQNISCVPSPDSEWALTGYLPVPLNNPTTYVDVNCSGYSYYQEFSLATSDFDNAATTVTKDVQLPAINIVTIRGRYSLPAGVPSDADVQIFIEAPFDTIGSYSGWVETGTRIDKVNHTYQITLPAGTYYFGMNVNYNQQLETGCLPYLQWWSQNNGTAVSETMANPVKISKTSQYGPAMNLALGSMVTGTATIQAGLEAELYTFYADAYSDDKKELVWHMGDGHGPSTSRDIQYYYCMTPGTYYFKLGSRDTQWQTPFPNFYYSKSGLSGATPVVIGTQGQTVDISADFGNLASPENTWSVSGVVRDESGAAVPNAIVELIDLNATFRSQDRVIADSSGNYTFTSKSPYEDFVIAASDPTDQAHVYGYFGGNQDIASATHIVNQAAGTNIVNADITIAYSETAYVSGWHCGCQSFDALPTVTVESITQGEFIPVTVVGAGPGSSTVSMTLQQKSFRSNLFTFDVNLSKAWGLDFNAYDVFYGWLGFPWGNYDCRADKKIVSNGTLDFSINVRCTDAPIVGFDEIGDYVYNLSPNLSLQLYLTMWWNTDTSSSFTDSSWNYNAYLANWTSLVLTNDYSSQSSPEINLGFDAPISELRTENIAVQTTNPWNSGCTVESISMVDELNYTAYLSCYGKGEMESVTLIGVTNLNGSASELNGTRTPTVLGTALFDEVAPALTLSTKGRSGTGIFTNEEPTVIYASFDEPVSGVDSGDFIALAKFGKSIYEPCSIGNVTAIDSTNYVFEMEHCGTNKDITIKYVGDVTDLAGNQVDASSVADLGYNVRTSFESDWTSATYYSGFGFFEIDLSEFDASSVEQSDFSVVGAGCQIYFFNGPLGTHRLWLYNCTSGHAFVYANQNSLVDVWGNTGPAVSTAIALVNFNLTPPASPTIVGWSPKYYGVTAKTSFILNFAIGAGESARCWADDIYLSQASPCSGSIHLQNLTPGGHEILIETTNAYGNTAYYYLPFYVNPNAVLPAVENAPIASLNSGEVTVEWAEAPSGEDILGVTGYEVEYTTDGAGWNSLGEFDASTFSTSFNAFAGVSFKFRVRAISNDGPGEYSAVSELLTVAATGVPSIDQGGILTPTPVVTGTYAVGATLTAHAGQWASGVTLSYQWLRNGVAIYGATGSTYLINAADLGKTISVRLTASKEGFATVSVTSATSSQIAEGTAIVLATPLIDGEAKLGATLVADAGNWSSDLNLAYQWLRDGAAVSGATSASYELGLADVGAVMTVLITGTKDGYQAGSMISLGTSAVLPGDIMLTPRAVISGSLKVGSSLTASPGTWDSGVLLAYQWLRDGSAIAGADGLTYRLTSADFGADISVMVTGSKSGFASTSTIATVTGLVVAGDLTLTPVPTVSGSLVVGSTLTAAAGSWDVGASVSYQWLRSGAVISGANRSTYELTAADFGANIQIKVTGSRAAYLSVSKVSVSGSAVGIGSLALVGSPAISGSASVGSMLTADAGAWDSGVALTYQWLRNGSPIAFAVGSTYVVASGDLGASLSVEITGTKLGYSAETVTSSSTASVVTGTFALSPTPTVVGSSMVGATLIASAGTWDSGAALAYQWLRNGNTISGATSATYALVADDRGKQVSVRVTATKAGVYSVGKTSLPTDVIGYGTLTVGAPAISGAAKVYASLSVDAGSVPIGVSVSYQWKRNGQPIDSATTSSYAVGVDDLAQQITVTVVASKAGYLPVEQTVDAGVVASGEQLLTPYPTISGTRVVGQTLTAAAGTWDADVTLAYQWYRGANAIVGAKSASYVLTAADLASSLSVTVTGSKLATADVTRSSGTTGSIAAASLGYLPVVQITGSASVESTVTAVAGDWGSSVAFAYQWYLDGVAISGAVQPDYSPTTADVGHLLSVSVTGSKPGYTTVTLASLQSVAVTLRSLTGYSVPVVSGSPVIGTLLQAQVGTWETGVSLNYQWYRSGVLIDGATSNAYILSSIDFGENVSVEVTATKPGFVTLVQQSAATADVEYGSATQGELAFNAAPKVGSALSVNTSSLGWASSVSVSWLKNGSAIEGVSGTSYVPAVEDLGAQLSAVITAHRSGLSDFVFTISADSFVAKGNFKMTTVPKILGNLTLGSELEVVDGIWDADAELTYQWLRDGNLISGATDQVYTLVAADVNHKISVRTTASSAGYNTVVKTSMSTTLVPMGIMSSATAPVISGSARVGQVLQVSGLTWGLGTTYTYKWLRNGTTIAGATGSSYTLTAKDRTRVISVQVTGKRVGYISKTLVSAGTSRVG